MSKGRGRYTSKLKEREFTLCLFVLLGHSKDWKMAANIGQGQIFFPQSSDSNANLFQKHPHKTQPEIMLYWQTGQPFTQLNGHIKLTITDIFMLILVIP